MYLCSAERRGCAGKHRWYVAHSSANVSSMASQDTPWSSKIFLCSRSPGDAETRGHKKQIVSRSHLENSSQGGSEVFREGRSGQLEASKLQRFEKLTGEGGDTWYGYVGSGVCVVVIANATVDKKDMAPVMQSSVNDTGQQPLGPC